MNRHALCIGINNYPGAALQGCINDAMDMAALLAHRGYIVNTLYDTAATREAMLDALEEAVGRLRYRDRLVVHYSGHGTKVPDRSGDEPDGWDEAWVSQDMAAITDDDLQLVFGGRPYGTRVVVVSDSCHAGTVTRVGGFGDTVAATYDPKRPRVRKAVPSEQVRTLEAWGQDRSLAARPLRRVISRSDVLLVAAASPTQYAYDAWFQMPDGQWRANGAFTRSLLVAMGSAPDTYRALLSRLGLPSAEYPQTPELDGSYHQQRWSVLD